MSDSPLIVGLNGTLVHVKLCTVDTCPMEYAQLDYIPSLSVNAAYLAMFVIFLIAHIGQGILYKTWGFMGGMVAGLFLEIIGYGARIGLHGNVFSFDFFVMYLVCLTIAPAFISASIYLCLSRIIVVCGEDIAPFKPRTYTLTFVCCDFVSLVLQAAGGALAASSDDSGNGVDIMVAGLAFQVVSLALYMGVAADFFLRVRKAHESQFNPRFHDVRRNKLFKYMTIALGVATVLIFVRCVYRVAELSKGFNSHLANDEVAFNILEGPMIWLAVLVLTAFHPGLCFRGAFQEANWTWRNGKASSVDGGNTVYPKGAGEDASFELGGRRA
ncbi:Sphingoid long-chain base transporter RSB1-like protein [Elsinoe fawcettii]|nr:Sphingoid long-chain base transporter RSB1-like protein [Elsinoe fawcettii]